MPSTASPLRKNLIQTSRLLGGIEMIGLPKREVEVAILLDLDGTLIQRYGEEEDFTPRPLADPGRIQKLGTPLAICSNQGGIAWGLAGGRPGKRYPDWPAMLERVRFGMRLAQVKVAFLALYHPLAPTPEDKEGLLEAARRIGMPEEVALAAEDPKHIVLLSVQLDTPGIPGVEEGTVFVSWNPEWRKPAPGMLEEAQTLLRHTRFIARDCRWIYIGDEEDDEKAARAARMDFLSAKEIRDPNAQERRESKARR
jgi:histidinol phosphatase-like enzyme